jgi:cold shock CspA family protein
MYSTETSSSETPVLIGCVKWFNSKVGYGFITLIDKSTNVEKDIFVHHSALNVSSEQYRYLIQGEYVNFRLIKSEDNELHEYCAGNVSGINGGKLMCETRHEYTQNKDVTNYSRPSTDGDRPRSKKPYIPRNRDSDRNRNSDHESEWKPVSKRR